MLSVVLTKGTWMNRLALRVLRHMDGDGRASQVQVTVTVCREGGLREVRVALGLEACLGTTSLVHFCGAQFQVGTSRS